MTRMCEAALHYRACQMQLALGAAGNEVYSRKRSDGYTELFVSDLMDWFCQENANRAAAGAAFWPRWTS